MFKVISMTDSNYFDAGKLFLETRSRINAAFILYGPDLNDKQINILKKNNIEYIKVDDHLYKTEMQFLKFSFILEQIMLDKSRKYDGFTLVDFDTFFINDWSHVFDYDFDYGITVRKGLNKKSLWAYTNGGVVFAKHSSYHLLEFAQKTILNGYSDDLPEYDRIWKTLETGRPEHKTHYRTVFRWWVDQVFLSALALWYFNKHKYCKVGFNPVVFNFKETKIGMFGCGWYNVLDSMPDTTIKKNIYIRHLKTAGRKVLGVDKTVEKLEV